MSAELTEHQLKKLVFNLITDEQWDEYFKWFKRNWPDSILSIEENKEKLKDWFKTNCECEKVPSIDFKLKLGVSSVVYKEDKENIASVDTSSFAMYFIL